MTQTAFACLLLCLSCQGGDLAVPEVETGLDTTEGLGLLGRILAPTPLGGNLDRHGISVRGFTNGNFTAASHTGENLPMGMNYLGNQFLLEQNTLIVEKPIDTESSERHWGFRTYSILPGSDYAFTVSNNLMDSQLYANNGLPNTYGVDVPEFWAQVWLPEFRTDVKVGRFFTIFCNESIDPCANRVVSRALTFLNNPFTNTGIVATTRAGENWTLTNGITCGNDVFFGPASGPMYLGGARYDSTDKHTSLAFNTTLGDNTFVPVRGPGRVYDVFEWLFSRDLVGVSDRLNYTLDIMYSILNDIDGAYYKRDGYFPRMYRGNASWYGFLNYFTYNFTDDLSGTFRFEVFDDPFGVRTGFEGVYTTYTLGAVWKMSEGLWLRPELRLDNNEQSKAYAFKNNLFTATADFILRW